MSRVQQALSKLPAQDRQEAESHIQQFRIDLGEVFKDINFSFLAAAVINAAISLIETTILPKLADINAQLAIIVATILDALQEALAKKKTATGPAVKNDCCENCDGCLSCTCCKDCEGCSDCTCCEDCTDCIECVDCVGQKGLRGKIGVKS